MWSLQTLDISHSRGVKGNLSVLMSQHITSLENLILHDCEVSLDRANAERKLPKLEDLDLSQNPRLVESFRAISSRWSNLKRLRIDYSPPDQSSLGKRVSNELLPLPYRGNIPSIQELRITNSNFFAGGRWEHLKRLDIVVLTDRQLNFMLYCLDKSAQMGDLPSLQTVCLLIDRKYEISLSIDRLRQTGVDICLVDPNLEKIMVNAGGSRNNIFALNFSFYSGRS